MPPGVGCLPAWLRGALVYLGVLGAAAVLVVGRPPRRLPPAAGGDGPAVPTMAPLPVTLPGGGAAGSPPAWLAGRVSGTAIQALSGGLWAAALATCGRDAQAAALLARDRASRGSVRFPAPAGSGLRSGRG